MPGSGRSLPSNPRPLSTQHGSSEGLLAGIPSRCVRPSMPRKGRSAVELRGAFFPVLPKLTGNDPPDAKVIGHADRSGPFRDYWLGLLMPRERKSVEPMAAVTAPARVAAKHQSLLHFIRQSPWSDEALMAQVRDYVLPIIERHGPSRRSHLTRSRLRRTRVSPPA